MAQFVDIPPNRLEDSVLLALLEEFASRDGTDYGERETPLDAKVSALHRQLTKGQLCLLYDADSEQWDLIEREQAQQLLQD
tara:strand:+ start:186605 stop:186847 length:243 start_codon:yes stop_codon:yes gene_type:complete